MYTVPAPHTPGKPTAAQQQMLARIRSQDTPDVGSALRSDGYKFTSLRDIAWALPADLPAATQTLDAQPRAQSDINECVLVVSATGELRFDQSKDASDLASHGVYAGKFSAATREVQSLFVPDAPNGTVAALAAFADDPFADRARALAQDPIIIHIPNDAELLRPIRIIHFGHQLAAHVQIRIGKNAQAAVIEECLNEEILNTHSASEATSSLFSGLTDVHAEAGARLRYVSVQGFGKSIQPFLRQRFLASRSAEIDYVGVTHGGSKGQTRIASECQGAGARISFKACARLDGTQHHDFWIHALHDTSDTSSTVDFWTVAADQSRSVFNGNLVITPRGIRTDAYQRNRNLMLSRRAIVDTIPKLEIATDDVKCAHGATISTVNIDQLYYLQSRGISRGEAEAMIIQGFTEPVVSLIPTPALRDAVATALAAKNGEVSAT